MLLLNTTRHVALTALCAVNATWRSSINVKGPTKIPKIPKIPQNTKLQNLQNMNYTNYTKYKIKQCFVSYFSFFSETNVSIVGICFESTLAKDLRRTCERVAKGWKRDEQHLRHDTVAMRRTSRTASWCYRRSELRKSCEGFAKGWKRNSILICDLLYILQINTKYTKYIKYTEYTKYTELQNIQIQFNIKRWSFWT